MEATKCHKLHGASVLKQSTMIQRHFKNKTDYQMQENMVAFDYFKYEYIKQRVSCVFSWAKWQAYSLANVSTH